MELKQALPSQLESSTSYAVSMQKMIGSIPIAQKEDFGKHPVP